MVTTWVLFIAICNNDPMPTCKEWRVNMPSKEVCEQVHSLNKLSECWSHNK